MKQDEIRTFTASGAVATNTVAALFDTAQLNADYKLSVQIAAVGAGGALIFECANSLAGPWVAVNAESSLRVITSVPVSGNVYFVPAYARYVRCRLTAAVTSGTTTVISTTVGSLQPGAATTTPSGTATVSISGTPTMVGAAAHDAAITGNPVRIGGRALTANYTAVASGDAADLATTVVGVLIEKPFSIPEADWSYAAPAGGIINNTAVAARAAAGAGLRTYVTGIDVRNASATVATEFAILDGATVIWRGQLPVNSGTVDIAFPSPIKSSANAALNIQCITTGAQVYANLRGYIAP